MGALLALILVAPRPVLAQDDDDDGCEPSSGEGPDEVTPAASAGGVSLGAVIRVLYSPGYFSTPIRQMSAPTLVRLTNEDGEMVTGATEIISDYLFFAPDELLRPRTRYMGMAVGDDYDLEFSFTTGTAVDTAPPRFGEIDKVDTARVDESCEAPDGGYRVDVSFAPATDDGPPGDIEYLLYATRGPEVVAPQLRARIRNYSTDVITMAFVIAPSEAVSPICIAVHAIDGVGNVDEDGEENCFEPIRGNFFEPLCSVGAAGAGSGRGWLALLALGLAAAVRRRRSRR